MESGGNELEDKMVGIFKTLLDRHRVEVNWDIHDEYTLRRFLRARNNDLGKSMQMFKDHLAWRKENRVDEILEWCPKENANFHNLRNYWPGNFHGLDKDGIPIFVTKIGGVDMAIVNHIPEQDVINYIIYSQEEGLKIKRKLSEKYKRNAYTGIVIADLGGASRRHIYPGSAQLFKKITSITEANYPESLKMYFGINAPTIASMGFKLFKPFIDKDTQKKITLISGDDMSPLYEYIDPSNLPAEYGGTCRCHGGCIIGGGPYSDIQPNGTTFNPTKASLKPKEPYDVTITGAFDDSTLKWFVKSPSKGSKVSLIIKKEEEELLDDTLILGDNDGRVHFGKGEITATLLNTGESKKDVVFHYLVETENKIPLSVKHRYVVPHRDGDKQDTPLALRRKSKKSKNCKGTPKKLDLTEKEDTPKKDKKKKNTKKEESDDK